MRTAHLARAGATLGDEPEGELAEADLAHQVVYTVTAEVRVGWFTVSVAAMTAGVNPSAAARAEYEREMKQMIDEHISSPSIVMWVTFNEGWGQYDEARIADQAKAWDPARLVNSMSGINLGVDGGTGDIIDEHGYPSPALPHHPDFQEGHIMSKWTSRRLQVWTDIYVSTLLPHRGHVSHRLMCPLAAKTLCTQTPSASAASKTLEQFEQRVHCTSGSENRGDVGAESNSELIPGEECWGWSRGSSDSELARASGWSAPASCVFSRVISSSAWRSLA